MRIRLRTSSGAQAELIRLFSQLKAHEVRAFQDRVEQAAFEAGLWTEVEGSRRPVGLTFLPRLVDRESDQNWQAIAWQVRLGLRRLTTILDESHEADELLALTPGEREWVRHCRSPLGERVFCRLDALMPETGPRFIETNVVGIGGMTYAPAASTAVFEALRATFPDFCSAAGLHALEDPRLLLLRELHLQAERLGLTHRLVIGLLDDCRLYRLGGEMGRLEAFLNDYGVTAVVVDPRELELDSQERIQAQGQTIDLIYRFLELGELAEIERETPLTALRAAFGQGRVVPSVAGDLDQKSTFELLTNEAFYHWFTKPQQRLYKKHVQWTRLIGERRTTDPEGNSVDLLGYLQT
ncbi:MAG: hypothetical protein KC910_35440, partial [Candidatus Eremiobacteraeota bacterium]|nr:hypothetical protein [Candidatus Eremiobacteraeota bacterium]